MKKATLLLIALAGFCLTEGHAQQEMNDVTKVTVSFLPQDTLILPLENSCVLSATIRPKAFADRVAHKDSATFLWSSGNSHISLTPEQDGRECTVSARTVGEVSIELTVQIRLTSEEQELLKMPFYVVKTSMIVFVVPQPEFQENHNDTATIVLAQGGVTDMLCIMDSWKTSIPPEFKHYTEFEWSVTGTLADIDNITLEHPTDFVDPVIGDTVVIRGINAGVANFSGWLRKSPNVRVVCTVYVLNSSATTLSMPFYLHKGESTSLSNTLLGLPDSLFENLSVTWKSQKDNIVSVSSDGTVQALQTIGKDTVIATLTSSLSNIQTKFVVYVPELKISSSGIHFMNPNDKQTFSATVIPEDLPNSLVRWKLSSKTQPFAFYPKGIDTTGSKSVDITTLQATGDIYLYAWLDADPTFRDSCIIVAGDFAVLPEKGQAILRVGESLQLTTYSKEPFSSELRWESSDVSIATVDATGKVTGMSTWFDATGYHEGFATISAFPANGAIGRSSIIVMVTNPRISFVGSPILRPGDKRSLSLQGASRYHVIWTSGNPDVAQVDADGVLTANAIGATTITATIGITSSIEGRTPIASSVLFQVSEIRLNKSKEQTIPPGGSIDFEATVYPELSTSNLRWFSSDTTVAIVDQYGHVTARKPGYTTIVAALADNEAVRATCPLRVWKSVGTVEIITTHTGTFERGKGYQFSTTVQPEDATAPRIQWSSKDSSIAEIDKTGWMTTRKNGTTQIRATEVYSGAYHDYNVTVITSTAGLFLNAASLSLREGDSYTLVASVLPVTATLGTVQWRSSDNDVATVTEETGVVYALSPGYAFIKAQANGHSDSCLVTVNGPLDSLYLDYDTLKLDRNKTAKYQLHLHFVPESSRSFYEKDIVWSSEDEEVASVMDGWVTPHKEGLTKITAHVEELEAVCFVEVIVPADSIYLNCDSAVIQKGDILSLIPFVIPADAMASQRQFTWSSSDESVATVSGDGSVEGIRGGTAVITATTFDGTHSVSCSVVVETPAEAIQIKQHDLSLNRGESRFLLYSVVPENASFRTPTWLSNDPNVAIVNAQGVVTAIGSGRATITATTQGYNACTDSCIVTVDNPITSLSMPTHITLEKGQQYTLSPTSYPTDATPQVLDWQAEDRRVAAVSNGLVQALRSGTTKIMTSAGEQTAETFVTVQVSTDILMLSGASSLRPGFDFTIVAHLFPTDVSQQKVEWEILTEDGKSSFTTAEIVQIVRMNDLSCTLHSQGKGKVIVRATSADGKVNTTHTVTILAPLSNDDKPLIDNVGGKRTAAYTADGLLLLTNLSGYTVQVFSMYGQPIDAFTVTSDGEYRQLYLSPGIYILSASKGNERFVQKFPVR